MDGFWNVLMEMKSRHTPRSFGAPWQRSQRSAVLTIAVVFLLHQGDHCNLPVQCGWRRDRSCLQIYITGLIKEMGQRDKPQLRELLAPFTRTLIFASSNVARCSLNAVGALVKQCLEMTCKFAFAWNGCYWFWGLHGDWHRWCLTADSGRCLSSLSVLM